jgi:autotransporter-associated beta strand protein
LNNLSSNFPFNGGFSASGIDAIRNEERSMKTKSRFLPASFCLALCTLPAAAQVWTNTTTDGLWSTAANWNPATVPTINTATATFTTPGTAGVRLDGATNTNSSLTFGNGSTFSIGNASGDTASILHATRTITVSDTGSYSINLTNGGGTGNTSTGAFNITSSTFNIAANGKLTLDGRYFGATGAARTITKSTGTGTLELTGDYTTTFLQTTLNAGTLVLNATGGNSRLLGLGSVAAGTTLRFDSANANLQTGTTGFHANTGIRFLSGTVDLNGFSNATTRIQGTATTGVITNNGSTDAVLTLGNFGETTGLAVGVTNPVFAGILQDGPTHKLGLTLTGGSGNKLTQTLPQVQTYTGPTIIGNDAALIVRGLSGASPITLNSGTLQIGSALSNTGGITIGTGGKLTVLGALSSTQHVTFGGDSLNLGGTSATGVNLSAPSLAQSAGSILLDLMPSSSDQLVISGAYTRTGGDLQVSLQGAPSTASPYALISAGSITGSPAVSITPDLTSTRFVSSTTTTGTALTASFTGASANLVWNGNTSAYWDVKIDANWTGADGLFHQLDNVTFNDSTANRTVDLDGQLTPNQILVDTSTLGGYTIQIGTTGSGIAGTAAGLIKSGTAPLLLGGLNTFVGPVLINGGTLRLTTPQALGSTAGVTVSSGTTLDINGQNLVAAGRFYDAVIAGNGTAGDGAVVNTGTALSASSSASGLRNLTLTADASIGGTGTFDIGFSGSIEGNGFKLSKKGANEVGVGGPANNVDWVVDSGNLLFMNAEAGGSSITLNGTGLLRSGVLLNLSQPITMNGGILENYLGGNTTVTGSMTLTGTPEFRTNNTTSLILDTTLTHSGNILINGPAASGTVLFLKNNNLTGSISVTGSVRLQLGTGGTTGSAGTAAINLAGTGLNGLILNRSDDFTLPNLVSGTGSLNKQGTNTVRLSVNNTHTGSTSASAGTLIIGNGATAGGIGTSALGVANGATAVFDRTDNVILGGALNRIGTHTEGTVNKLGAGSLTLTVANGSFAGAINVLGGSFVFNATNATNQGANAARINLSPGTILTNGPATVHNHIGNISLNNATWTTGDGTGEYNGENYQLNGDVTVLGSAPSSITRDPSRNNGNSGVALLAARTFTVADVTASPATDLVVSTELENADSGSGVLVKAGPGTMELTVAPSYTGGTTVGEGTLIVPGLPSGGVTVSAGARLIASNAIAGPIVSTGTLAPVPGIGTLTVNSNVTLSGTLAVEVDATTNDLLDVFGALDLTGSNLTVSALAPGFSTGVIAIANSIAGLPSAPVGYSLAVQAGAIAGTEELVLTATGGGNNFASWLTANAPGQSADDDHDNDGVPNGVEFFMGQSGSGFTPNPAAVDGTVTWPKDPTAIVTYVVKTSPDLVVWTNATSGVTDNGSSLEFTLPEDEDRIFVRLEVTIP